MSAGRRKAWIDLVKGVAIILVVLIHVNSNGRSSNILVNGLWKDIYIIIKSFIMPLFFFISGYLTSWSKEPLHTISRRFLKREICLIVPYIFFSILFLICKVVFTGSEAVVNSEELNEITSIAIKPIGEYWFLYALFIHTFVLYLINVIAIYTGERVRKYLLILTWVISIVYFHFKPLSETPFTGLNESLIYLHYYIAGCLVKESQNNYLINHRKILLAVFSVASCILLFLKIRKIISNPSLNALIAYMTIWCIIVSLHNKRCGWLEYCGTYSLPIYLLHVFTIVIFKVFWKKLGIDSELLYVIIATTVSVVLPLILYNGLIKKIKPLDFLINPRSYLTI